MTYTQRVRDLIGDWCRLTSMPAATSTLLTEVVESVEPFGGPFERGAHPSISSLCSDRSPIEICERLACRPLGPALTYEPAACDRPPKERFATSLDCAARAVSAIPRAQDAVRATAAAIDETGAASTIWIGVDCDEAGDARTKVHYSFDGRAIENASSRCERALSQIWRKKPARLEHTLRLLQEQGYLRMLSLSFGKDGFAGAKVYARLKRVDLATLRAFTELAEVSVEPFDRYVRRILGRSRSWFDARAGIGVALNDDGSAVGVELYHYTAGYFDTDEGLRARVLATANEFDWSCGAYRTTSRLFDAGAGAQTRSLLGFGVSAAHGAGLNAYARTGYLAA